MLKQILLKDYKAEANIFKENDVDAFWNIFIKVDKFLINLLKYNIIIMSLSSLPSFFES